VDSLDLAELDFVSDKNSMEGRPTFETLVFLKLYLDNYFNRIYSSRHLEKSLIIRFNKTTMGYNHINLQRLEKVNSEIALISGRLFSKACHKFARDTAFDRQIAR